ncbi:MAG TPA: hypothetical protein GX531_03170 [Methanothermobacter sp.]|nr:hypothetical protein [Methanothermobacter sp.]
MDDLERFKEILIQIPFDHYDLNVVNREEYLLLFEELFEIYENSTPAEKNSMEMFVQSDQDFIYKFVHWMPPYEKSDPKRYVKYRLLTVTIRDGRPDFRDDLLELVHLWDFLEEKGLDPQKIFEEVNQASESFLIQQVMDPERREELRFRI